MKTLRFLLALCFCWALARAPSLARSAGEDFTQTRSEKHSNSSDAQRSGQANRTQRPDSSTVAHEQRMDASHPTSEKTAHPSALGSTSGHAAVGAAALGQREFGRTSGTSAISVPHQLPLSQAISAPKDPRNDAEKNHTPAPPPFNGQRTAGLPVQPSQNRASSLSAIGGTTAAPLAKNTAALNGTGLRHRP